jgi:hypothetical protein
MHSNFMNNSHTSPLHCVLRRIKLVLEKVP